MEDITFRSTKIRTLANALTVVPNSKLCGEPITNWTRMKMRLAQFTLGRPTERPSEPWKP
ncbi:MAG: mechanosensitive ion channel domain-containing protein [Ruthenibacterium lactatiformans]